MTVTNNKKKDLMDAKTMDGPKIHWAPADVLKPRLPPKIFLTYHVMSAGYDHLTPLGSALGAMIGMSPLGPKYFSNYSTLQLAGNSGLIGGCTGMILGLGGLYAVASSGGKNPNAPPWTEEGIQMRVDGLSQNFNVRVMDVGVWIGLATAGTVLLAAGGPTKLHLSPGPLGAMQALSLGSAAGGWTAILYRMYKK